MKKVLGLLVLFAIVFSAMALLLLTQGRSGYRVDAIFDDVDFLIPGQDVRIAGASAGQVLSIKLTKDLKARVQMVINHDFAPFHADANCTIAPQSLIGDRFVNCTPGTPAAPVLEAQNGEPPTLPVTNTSAPVDLDLVLQTLNMPVRERAALLIDSLGVGLAARGADLNATILRANPALQETRNVLHVLNENKAQLQSLISASDVVLRHLAQSRQRVGAFVRNSADILQATATHRTALEQAIVRLPPLLAQARPTLAELGAFARQGTPAATELNAAAPSLNSLLYQLQSFSPQVLPTIKRLGSTATTLQDALPSVTPQIERLRGFASIAPTAGQLIATLFSSLRSSGAADGLLEFVYYAAASFARYDSISHILPAYTMVTPCEFVPLATASSNPIPGCNAHFSSWQGPGAHARRAAGPHAARHGVPHAGPRTSSARLTPSAAPSVQSAPATAAAPSTPTAAPTQTLPTTISSLLRFLLR